MKAFTDFELSEPMLRAIRVLGFEEATPIQEQTITLGLAGDDLIGQAPTGTGKTAAFGIPLIEEARNNRGRTQALVVTPTRELAIQVSEELNKLAQFCGVSSLPVYGGQDIARQIRALKKNPEIIVGTPGRLLDHIRRRTLRLGSLSAVVLDEADEMLNMGFLEDITAILKETPADRQTMLFSATIPRPIEELAQQFMRDPQLIRVAPKQITAANTDQFFVEVPEHKKFDILCNLLDMHGPASAIVFGRTKRRAAELCEALNTRGYSADALHGDLTQAQRDSVMKQFRTGTIEILTATDVAARGLDISDVTHVYNFDVPQDPESYVHRIGRTGRAGRTGTAISFVTSRELNQIRFIERLTRRPIKRMPMPTLTEALAGQQQATVERIQNAIHEDRLNSEYRPIAEELLDQTDSITVVAAALRLLTKEPNKTPVTITAERPQRAKTAGPKHRKSYGPRSTGKRGYHGKKGRRS